MPDMVKGANVLHTEGPLTAHAQIPKCSKYHRDPQSPQTERTLTGSLLSGIVSVRSVRRSVQTLAGDETDVITLEVFRDQPLVVISGDLTNPIL